MKQYKVVKVSKKPEDTEMNLNLMAGGGWEFKAPHCGEMWLIMEKDVEEMDIADEDFVEFEEYADFEVNRDKKAKRNKAYPYSKHPVGNIHSTE